MTSAAEADTELTAERLRFAVTRLARRLRQHAGTGLTPTQLATLATVERTGPVPIGAVAEAEQISAPTATKTVDKLHAAGLVDRITDPNDRRVSLVSVTDDGRDLLVDTRRRKAAWLAARIHALEPGEIATLAAALDVLEHLTTPNPPEPPEPEDAR
jgi:DNA-binding MarR family transcriptional regulator